MTAHRVPPDAPNEPPYLREAVPLAAPRAVPRRFAARADAMDAKGFGPLSADFQATQPGRALPALQGATAAAAHSSLASWAWKVPPIQPVDAHRQVSQSRAAQCLLQEWPLPGFQRLRSSDELLAVLLRATVEPAAGRKEFVRAVPSALALPQWAAGAMARNPERPKAGVMVVPRKVAGATASWAAAQAARALLGCSPAQRK